MPIAHVLDQVCARNEDTFASACRALSRLSDDDLAFTEGKEDELLGRLQQKLGKTKEDLRREIESL